MSTKTSKSVASLTNKLTVLTINQVIEREAAEAAEAAKQKVLDKYKEGSPDRIKKEKGLVLVPLLDEVTRAQGDLQKFLDGIKDKRTSFEGAVSLAKAEVSKKALEVGIDDPYRARNVGGGKGKIDGDILYEFLDKEGDKTTQQIMAKLDIKGDQTVRKWFEANGAKFGIYMIKGHTRTYSVKKPS